MRLPPLNIQQHLQGVSRSFALSIRVLPAALREPVGLAYLLARTADTIADTTSQPAPQRLALLGSLQHAIDTADDHPQLALALCDFARHVPDPHEKALLERGQDCLEALARLPAPDQSVIRQVLAAILEGQRWDLHTLDGPQRGVQTRDEVERYTWQVAGSVGEFWTRMGELHLQQWHTGTTAELLQWGANYGKGLQRLNILRDAHRDLYAGRCYFPAEELHPLGLDHNHLCNAVRMGDRAPLQQLAPLLTEWHRITEALLHDGLRYSLALRGRRLRLATALPCLIGIRTLTLLRQAGPQALLSHIKLPRTEVRKLLLALLLGGISDKQLIACWSAGLLQAKALPGSARIDA
ncbi:MAG: squalene/phytoene synthase family protein [Limnohabitans sp.]